MQQQSFNALSFAFLVLGTLTETGCASRDVPKSIEVYSVVSAEGDFRAGAAAVDITPDGDVWLAGFDPERRSDGVHDPLYARALVLQRGELNLVLVAIDAVGIQRGEIVRIQAGLSELKWLDPRHVVIASTHTHGGPDTLGLWGEPPFVSGIDRDYMDQLQSGVIAAVAKAHASLRPAEVASGAVQMDAKGLMKNLRRPGIVDRELVVVHVRERESSATIATWVEFGCHPEVVGDWNTKVTADFPHWTVSRIERDLGGVAVYVSGALGAMVSPDVWEAEKPEVAWAEAERVGLRVAEGALGVVRALASQSEKYERDPQLALWHAPLYILNRNSNYTIARWMGLLERERLSGGYFETEVNLWQIVDLRVATVPGELPPHLGLQLKRFIDGHPTMIVGLANDELGYLLPSSEFELPIYEYERELCPGFDAGDRVVARLEELALLAAESEAGAQEASSAEADPDGSSRP